MKKILLSSVFALAAITANAQLAPGSTAPDFTATDIYGESHSLYADYLDQGKVVLLNISATWCGPCWNYHNSHHLADFYEAYGPNGSDEAMVLYVEGDPSTPVSAIFGEVSAPGITLGDWTEGTPYPIIDNGTIANQYQITYFPTLYRICSGGVTTELNQLSATNLRNNLSSNCETLVGVPNHVKVLPADIYTCSLEGAMVSFEIRNYGNNNITEAVLALKKDGVTIATANYEGSVEQFSNAVVEFDGLDLELGASYTAELESINGGTIHYQEYATAEVGEIIVAENEVEHVNLEVKVYTDNYPTEISWNIKDSSGNIIANAGPYQGNANGGGADAITTKTHSIEVDVNECYTIELLDSYGDGWSYTGGPASGIEVFENGNSIVFVDGSVSFGDGNSGNPLVKAAAFKTGATLDTDTFEVNTFAMYPNPSNGIVNISATETVNIDIIDVTGKTVHQAKSLENNSIIDLSSLPKGVYLVKVSGEKTNTTEKLILN